MWVFAHSVFFFNSVCKALWVSESKKSKQKSKNVAKVALNEGVVYKMQNNNNSSNKQNKQNKSADKVALNVGVLFRMQNNNNNNNKKEQTTKQTKKSKATGDKQERSMTSAEEAHRV